MTPPDTGVPGPTGFSPLPTIRQTVKAKNNAENNAESKAENTSNPPPQTTRSPRPDPPPPHSHRLPQVRSCRYPRFSGGLTQLGCNFLQQRARISVPALSASRSSTGPLPTEWPIGFPLLAALNKYSRDCFTPRSHHQQVSLARLPIFSRYGPMRACPVLSW